MSIDGTSFTFVPYTLNGINPVASSTDISNCVKYTGNTSNTNLNGYDLETTGTLAAQYLALPADNTKTENFVMYSISTNGNLSSIGGLITTDITNGRSMYFTGGVLGAPGFQFTTLGSGGKIIVTNADGVMSTTINAGQLEYISALTSQAGGVGQTNLWTGSNSFTQMTEVASLRITSSVSNADFSLSVNAYDLLEIANVATSQATKMDGGSIILPGNCYAGGTVYSNDLQLTNASYFGYGTGTQWATLLNSSGEYEIQDDASVMRLRLSKSTGLTVSTLNITQAPTATPTYTLGVNGGGQVVKFTPSGGGTVNISSLTAGYIPYASSLSTLTNSPLYRISATHVGLGNITPLAFPITGTNRLDLNGELWAGYAYLQGMLVGQNNASNVPANYGTFSGAVSGQFTHQVFSHTGSSPYADATWSYTNATAAPVSANTGTVAIQCGTFGVSAAPGGFVASCPIVGTTTITAGTTVQSGAVNARVNLGRALGTGEKGMVMSFDQANNLAKIQSEELGVGYKSLLLNPNGGNVGIGITSAPSYALQIQGTVAADGSIIKQSATATSYFQIAGGNATNSPYIEFFFGGSRRMYIGYATATSVDLWAESGTNMNFGTNGSQRFSIKATGDAAYTAGDSSYMKFGPNATWSSYLVVGATPDRAGASTAQVISTNGNLHLDGGNSNDIYYGYYSNSRSTPNVHRFYGQTIRFESDVPQNTSSFSQVAVYDGVQLKRSQCAQRLVYFSNSVAWGGGVNMTYAFYLYNTACSVHILGKNSGWYSGAGMMQTTIRVYSQSSGAYYYYPLNAFVNVGNNHFTVPLNYITSFPTTGWYDIYVYSTSGWITDGNDQLTIGVQVLPAGGF